MCSGDDVDVALGQVPVGGGVPLGGGEQVADVVPRADHEAFVTAVDEGGHPGVVALDDVVGVATSAGAEVGGGASDQVGAVGVEPQGRVAPVELDDDVVGGCSTEVPQVGVDGVGLVGQRRLAELRWDRGRVLGVDPGKQVHVRALPEGADRGPGAGVTGVGAEEQERQRHVLTDARPAVLRVASGDIPGGYRRTVEVVTAVSRGAGWATRSAVAVTSAVSAVALARAGGRAMAAAARRAGSMTAAAAGAPARIPAPVVAVAAVVVVVVVVVVRVQVGMPLLGIHGSLRTSMGSSSCMPHAVAPRRLRAQGGLPQRFPVEPGRRRS